ncbi:hypothetical protein MACJ_001469 [Theileria orientalis]|uniref:Uncharacterized protein n=1 Tax=Theileria orientalis TaxID=68886 RepID=A0A976QRJ8_THEOR|nr:hypothetical protein MACJ_001469 [Theileria orientalis]
MVCIILSPPADHGGGSELTYQLDCFDHTLHSRLHPFRNYFTDSLFGGFRFAGLQIFFGCISKCLLDVDWCPWILFLVLLGHHAAWGSNIHWTFNSVDALDHLDNSFFCLIRLSGT